MASRDTFGGFTFAALSSKNIPVVIAVIISPSLIESSMFFLKHITYFWWFNRLFFVGFIYSLRRFLPKKSKKSNCTNSYGQNIKNTNISITLIPNQNYSFIYKIFSSSYLKHITSFWCFNKLFFVGFICSLRRFLPNKTKKINLSTPMARI